MYASITVNDVKLYIDILAIPYSLLIHTRVRARTHTHHTKYVWNVPKKPSPFLSSIDSTTNFESTFTAIKILLRRLFFKIFCIDFVLIIKCQNNAILR